jgi:hypothetical protein
MGDLSLIFKYISEILDKHGAAPFVGVLFLIFLCLYMVYKLKFSSKEGKIVEELRSFKQYATTGWLQDGDTQILRDYIYGRNENFKNKFLSELLHLYESKYKNCRFTLNEFETERAIMNKYKEIIHVIDKNVKKIPNMERTSLNIENKIEQFEERYVEEFVNLFLSEDRDNLRESLKEVIQRMINTNGY